MSRPVRRPLRTAAQLESYAARAAARPWHVVRHDGVQLAGCATREAAERIAANVSPWRGYAVVTKRGVR